MSIHEPQPTLMECRYGPEHRWQAARRYAADDGRPPAAVLDTPTRAAIDYLRLLRDRDSEAAGRRHPIVAAACQLRGHAADFDLLRIALLGQLPQNDIAARLDVAPSVVALAEALFFDVAPRRQATSWMDNYVFRPMIQHNDVDLYAKMQIAYHGGPAATCDLLDAEADVPLEEALRLADQQILLHAKFKAALAFKLDAASAGDFVKCYLEYDLRRRQLELEREAFQREAVNSQPAPAAAPETEDPAAEQDGCQVDEHRTPQAGEAGQRPPSIYKGPKS